jgi:hypothetical protein
MAKEDAGSYVVYDGTGTNDNDILLTTDEVSNYDSFELLGSAGAVDVEVLLKVGGSWSTAPITLQDLGAASLTPVLVTASGRLYGFVGNFHQLRVRQNGATASAYVLRGFKSGR